MYVWSKLSNSQWIDAWEERFSGNSNLVIEYLKGGKSVRLRLFCESKKEADAVVERFGGSARKLVSADWNKVVEPPKPVKIRDAFVLTAETRPKELAALKKANAKRDLIVIPPEMAFGTGDHATTSTCLRLLVDVGRTRKNTKWSVADLGTGTGVLAIAATKLGCAEAYACDFDPFAVAVAARNAERNETSEIVVKEQDVLKWKPRKKGYDVVLANLFSTVLIEAWPVIARSLAPGGDLIVSGILATQAWDVFTAAAEHGIGFPQVIKKGKWVTARGGHLKDLIEAPDL
ncbi:50S ribosomal protein L11 methyltransferase [Luteolibacter pohnpeiensis]|uniref:50S ribosomal protein L11 methyltransferase n=1 Tax=Luteolibacter pohnpeiensis TaxID=454153 RepID=A0A934SC39_9BACT|nr:50S ribosomal protein L11 methyltransferase [Luteolibacter pohnpeiensis]MBK1882558.1 50S ribosomal protein L11 methyltransferase [Luteolibacter pohnpeiensis]